MDGGGGLREGVENGELKDVRRNQKDVRRPQSPMRRTQKSQGAPKKLG